MGATGPLHVRWLGRVPYREALDVQEALFRNGRENHLLLMEHPHVFTYGPRSELDKNLLVDPASVGADFVGIHRGGDITYHGPGQLVGYPIVSLPPKHGGAAGPPDTQAHYSNVEQLIIDALAELGLPNAGRFCGYPGVWLDVDGANPRKICPIGVRVSRGRTMHGFALSVDPDMRYMREYIIPCGIAEYPVTSLAEEGVTASMADVVDVVSRLAASRWGSSLERQDVAWRHRPEDLSAFSRGEGPGAAVRNPADHGVTPQPVRMLGRLSQAGVSEAVPLAERKPEWLRPKVHHGSDVLRLKKTVRDLNLVTVCEEAGCPNLSECWADGTATFMVLGERCTRACGFCLVDTSKPMAPADDEPARVADAVVRMELEHAVLTMVARDDLPDGGMAHVAACVEAIRLARPATRVETLISDVKGDLAALDVLLAARPDVVNHNVETVPRLQRAVRPSAGYARSLAVLAHAKRAGFVAKSGLIVGMGETTAEIDGVLADLATLGVDIVTIGQYLRPTSNHLPVHHWVEPAEFERWKALGESLGIGHVESSPLTRSSYHARGSAESVSVRSG
jgi:lipoic acid synthetase